MLAVLLWLALGGTAILLSNHFNRPINLCLFKRLTGISCPTCGFTRGGLSLLKGHVIQAWLYNPLLFSALSLLSIAIAIRLIFGRSLQIHLTRKEHITAWILAIAMLFINWAYVVFYTR
jgi:uncharacterized membrane protein